MKKDSGAHADRHRCDPREGQRRHQEQRRAEQQREHDEVRRWERSLSGLAEPTFFHSIQNYLVMLVWAPPLKMWTIPTPAQRSVRHGRKQNGEAPKTHKRHMPRVWAALLAHERVQAAESSPACAGWIDARGKDSHHARGHLGAPQAAGNFGSPAGLKAASPDFVARQRLLTIMDWYSGFDGRREGGGREPANRVAQLNRRTSGVRARLFPIDPKIRLGSPPQSPVRHACGIWGRCR
jgi:hypothetical protein